MIDWSKIDTKKLADDIAAAIMRLIEEDEEGRLWIVDKQGNRSIEIVSDDYGKVEKTQVETEVIKEASQLSLQKKEERLVTNLPAWLKDRLKKKADQTGRSMNEIIRIALTEYLSKQQ